MRCGVQDCTFEAIGTVFLEALFDDGVERQELGLCNAHRDEMEIPIESLTPILTGDELYE